MTKKDDAFEAYRLHQRDVMLACFEDAEHIVRRRHSLHPKEETLLVAELLFEKRCAPYKYFRDEWRAEQALRKRAPAAPPGASGADREPQPA